MTSLLDKAAVVPRTLTHRELVELLTWPDADALFAAAYEVKCREIGRFVSFRGLVEFGNICEKDCYYCGIRKSNGNVHRYRMDADEIVREAEWAFKEGYGSLVLQSGELTGEANATFVENASTLLAAMSLALPSASASRTRKLTAAGAKPARTAICCALRRPIPNFTRSCILQTIHGRGGATRCEHFGAAATRWEAG